MNRIILWFAFWPMLAFAENEACWSGELSEFWSVGSAQNAAGQLLYCEFHKGERGGEKNTVIYRLPTGDVIAEKSIIWDTSRTMPDIDQQDLRTGERIQAFRGDSWTLSYRETRNSKLEQVNLALTDIDVVDAGFDQKVRNHWDDLVAGERLRVMFAAPALQRSVPLRITRRDPRHCAHASTQDWICFWAEADNALVRLFVDPLRLSYDQQRRLRVFSGVVNIRNEEGKKQSAIIHYRYAEDMNSEAKMKAGK